MKRANDLFVCTVLCVRVDIEELSRISLSENKLKMWAPAIEHVSFEGFLLRNKLSVNTKVGQNTLDIFDSKGFFACMEIARSLRQLTFITTYVCICHKM